MTNPEDTHVEQAVAACYEIWADNYFDLDMIEADPYGRAKLGEGDLRILAQRIVA